MTDEIDALEEIRQRIDEIALTAGVRRKPWLGKLNGQAVLEPTTKRRGPGRPPKSEQAA